jgi:hypothetical protein
MSSFGVEEKEKKRARAKMFLNIDSPAREIVSGSGIFSTRTLRARKTSRERIAGEKVSSLKVFFFVRVQLVVIG